MTLIEVQVYMNQKTPWTWRFMDHKTEAYEFEVTDPSSGRSTKALIPYKADEKKLRLATKSLRDYFDFFRKR